LRALQKFCGGTYHIHYNAAATSYYMVAIIALGVWSNWTCRYGNVKLGFFFPFFEKHRTREQEKKKEWTESPNERPLSKVQNAQWGALKGENTKPNTSTHHHWHKASPASRWAKNLEGHQAEKKLLQLPQLPDLQNNGSLNFLKSHLHLLSIK
jgi:hypothetical protein